MGKLDSDQTGYHIRVSVVSQFLSATRTTHLQAVMRILRYLKKAPGGGFLYSDYGYPRVAGFLRCELDRVPF